MTEDQMKKLLQTPPHHQRYPNTNQVFFPPATPLPCPSPIVSPRMAVVVLSFRHVLSSGHVRGGDVQHHDEAPCCVASCCALRGEEGGLEPLDEDRGRSISCSCRTECHILHTPLHSQPGCPPALLAQASACYSVYNEFFRCEKFKGKDAKECFYLKQSYYSRCPSEWVSATHAKHLACLRAPMPRPHLLHGAA